jgi:hypothetical protein
MKTLSEVLLEYKKRNITRPTRLLYESQQEWLNKAIKLLDHQQELEQQEAQQ